MRSTNKQHVTTKKNKKKIKEATDLSRSGKASWKGGKNKLSRDLKVYVKLNRSTKAEESGPRMSKQLTDLKNGSASVQSLAISTLAHC